MTTGRWLPPKLLLTHSQMCGVVELRDIATFVQVVEDGGRSIGLSMTSRHQRAAGYVADLAGNETGSIKVR